MVDLGNSIELHNVSVRFKSRRGLFKTNVHHALRDVSFNLKKGETLGVIGRNGCGKSTLLKVLSGIFAPNSGKIVHFDNFISLQTLSAGFDGQLSGRDNAIISSMLLGMSHAQALATLESIIDFSGLNKAFDEPVKTYSSGMKARLGFSIAIKVNADVLLIDEVLGVGDKAFRDKAEAVLISKMKTKQTVVFVSHAASQVEKLCDRVLWLEKGRVVKIGDTSELVAEYEALN